MANEADLGINNELRPGGPEILHLDASAGDSLVVPGGDLILVADYIRDGSDLLLIGPDGTQVVIEDYFATGNPPALRSEEHTSELQSLMRISYAVFCLKKKKHKNTTNNQTH